MRIPLTSGGMALGIDPAHLRLDNVTHLPDRHGLADILQNVFDRATAQSLEAAFFVIGIDRMTFINEAVGEKGGNMILREVGRRLSMLWGDRAHVCWLGGDRYGVVVIARRERDIAGLGEDCVDLFRHPHENWPLPVHITASIGGVSVTRLSGDCAAILAAAEKTMLQAKQHGGNRFVYFRASSIMTGSAAAMAERVRNAIEHDNIHFAFQPIIETSSGRTLYYEALARLVDEQGAVLPAKTFMPIVEQLGLTYDFDCRVLNRAVGELFQNQDLQLAVNITGTTAARPEWPRFVNNALDGRRDLASRLIIEITKTADIADLADARRFVEMSQALGGRVAIDDFGDGFASISHLKELAVKIMKIDRDLIMDIVNRQDQQTLLRALVALARGLGLRVVAEGVESKSVADWLSAENVDWQQGYYYGRPELGRPWVNVTS